MCKKAKITTIIAITVVFIFLTFTAIVYLVKVEMGFYDLSCNIATYGWDGCINYSMLSDELKAVISEEEFNDRTDKGRLSMYRKLEDLIIDDRPRNEFKGGTFGLKNHNCYIISMDNEYYYIDIEIDLDEKFFSPVVVNFTTHIQIETIEKLIF